MKHTLLFLLAALMLSASGSCQITPHEISQKEVDWYSGKIEQLEVARDQGDQEAEALILSEIEPFETVVIARRADYLTKLVAGVYPPAAPLVPFLPSLLVSFGIPLVGRRGREHFIRGLKAIAPGVMGANGKRGLDWRLAVASALRYFGPAHTEGGKLAVFARETAPLDPAHTEGTV